MNIYKILVLSCGNATTYIVEAYDAVQAIHSNGINPSEIVKLELIDTSNVINNVSG